MSAGRAPLAWVLFVAAALAWGAAIVVALPRVTNPLAFEDALWGLSFLALSAVGAVAVSRREGDVFGWLLVVSPLLMGVGVLADDYAGRVVEGAAWPAADWIGLVGNASFALATGGLALAMFRFPDGATLGPWWRRVEFATVAAALAGVLAAVTSPWVDEEAALANPVVDGRTVPGADVFSALSELLLVGGLLSMVALFVRYHRAGPRVRAQLRWVLYPAALGVGYLLVVWGIVTLTDWEPGDGYGVIATLLFTVGIPAGILAAISRERLYDIDRLISRTVSYAVVTAVLLTIYASIAVLPVVAFDLTGDVPVALATLAAAAAFRPVRARVQRRVDRRFHRARYDAQRVIDRFGEGLRDQVDLASLSAAARRAAAETVQPLHVAVWLPVRGAR